MDSALSSTSALRDDAAPLISVAMCTYNGEAFLARQLDTILAQSYANIEVIIFDDGSTDATIEILEGYQKRDHRIRLFRNERNQGFIKNFELAVNACKGEYIALADQDDIWLPEKITTLYNEIGDNLLVYSRVALIDQDEKPVEGEFPRLKRLEGHCALSLIVDNCVTGHTCLLHRDLVKMTLPFPDTLFSHDQWLAITAAASGRLKASDKILSLYRIHGGNALLRRKKQAALSKAKKNQLKLQQLIAFTTSIDRTGALPAQEQALLQTLMSLLHDNENTLYNWKLSRFLNKHCGEFMQLYKKPKKAIRKLCRGIPYFRLMDFFTKSIPLQRKN